MTTHTQMIETIEHLEKLVKQKYPTNKNTPDKSPVWQTRRKQLNQLWNFRKLIKEDK